MKPRLPTAEERRIWRESNQHTDLSKPEKDDSVEATPSETPSPVGGGLGRGRNGAPPHPDNGPLLTSPLQGEGQTRSTSSPKKTTPAPLAPLTQREAAKRLKPYGTIEATLDLHGLTKLDAHARVLAFIAQQARAGRRHILIITGKGRTGDGVLRTHVPHWLNEAPLRPLVSGFAHGRPEKGGAGVLHVLLKRHHG